MIKLDEIGGIIRANLEEKYQAREKGIALSRSIIRDAANAIRAAHRAEHAKADELLAKATAAISELEATLKNHPDVYYAGFVQDAQKEYAEASITCALIAGRELPSPSKLQIDFAPYLNGLGEAVGELRRHILDALRRGQFAGCEEILQDMDEIYSLLVTLDYPDAITGGLRRTTDVARGILEKTRGDLTLAIRQQQLEQTLHELEADLKAADLHQGASGPG